MSNRLLSKLPLKYTGPVLIGPLLLLGGCNETTAAKTRSSAPVEQTTNAQLQLLNRINTLENELARLNNTVEVQQNEMQRLQERLNGVYGDLDGRLRGVEMASPGYRAAPVTPAATMTTDSEIPSVPQSAVSASTSPAAAPASPIAPDEPATGTGTSTSIAPQPPNPAAEAGAAAAPEPVSQLEQQLYDRAFDYLKQSRYDEAIAAFKEFQTRFPRSSLADSAQYWIAEARYVNQVYDAALHEYNVLIQNYPASDRLPDAMLKVGYIHYDNAQWEQARRALNAVVIRYPGTRVAVSAKMRLDQMTKQGH
jgi:tol-pal system protein YbgF